MRAFITVCTLIVLAVGAHAEPQSPEFSSAKEFEQSLHFKRGHIVLPGGLAALDVPPSFRYLDPNDTERVLVDAWGNPPGSQTLGMLFPTDIGPFANNAWGVVIEYTGDGHISDEDADAIDYDDLLARMREDTDDANEERKKIGYEPVRLVGWAQPPHYDQGNKKLYWAKEIKFGSSEEHTLNYNIRVLGREGVLELNAVAGMSQLSKVENEMQDVLTFANFNEGHRYADFDASTDHVAAYGLAALVGGAVAAKTGLLAKLLAMLIAAKKFLIAIVIGFIALVKRLFGRSTA